MAKTIVMPKLGLTMTEGKLSKWLKKVGEEVKKGESLFEVETDKLTNTAEANADGILGRILVAEGETVSCLTPVADLLEPGETLESITGGSDAVEKNGTEEKSSVSAPASPAAKKLARENKISLSQVTGTGPKGRITLSDVEQYLKKQEKEPQEEKAKSSPLAAKIADEHQINLSDVQGEGSRIMSADVLAHLNAAGKQEEEELPMSHMRKIIAKRMKESREISPDVHYDISVDMTGVKGLKAQLANEGIKVSYTDILIQFTAKALMEFPLLNASIDGDTIILKHYVNMGIAVALEDGLLVPVIRDAHRKGLREIGDESRKLAEDARKGSLDPGLLSGGTFSITNLGIYGIESFTPIINQPETAILGVNAILDSPVVRDGAIVVRPIMKLSLVADHRAVDGAVAARFMARLKKLLEVPGLLLG